MTYTAILENFSLRWLVRSLEEEMLQLVFLAKTYRDIKPKDQLKYILDHLLLRWNCVFSSKETEESYKFKTYITIATLLHKYGYQDKEITKKAIEGLNNLKSDKYDFMPSHMYKKVDEAIKVILSPVELKKTKPAPKKTITQFRRGDILSVEIGKMYYAALVTEIVYVNEFPVLALFDKVFTKEPKDEDLKDISLRDKKFGVTGLNYLPDMACQIKLIGTRKLDDSEKKDGFFLSDICHFIEKIQEVFSKKK